MKLSHVKLLCILVVFFCVLYFPRARVDALYCPYGSVNPDNPYPQNGVLSDGVHTGFSSAPVGSTITWTAQVEGDANGVSSSFYKIANNHWTEILPCRFDANPGEYRSCSYTFDEPGSYVVTHHLKYPSSLSVCAVYELGSATYCAESPCAHQSGSPANLCDYYSQYPSPPAPPIRSCYLAEKDYSLPADGAYFTIFASSPTPSATSTPTRTLTPTPTQTLTPTSTLTYTPTRTQTQTPTATPTHSPTNTPTNTSTPTFTPSPTFVPIPTSTPTLTHTPTSSPTRTPTPTASPTLPPTHTPIPTDTLAQPPLPPSALISGVFAQRTGPGDGIWIYRESPGSLSGKSLPLRSVTIDGLQSFSASTGYGCATTSCNVLPEYPIPPDLHDGYQCGIHLPEGCTLISPQTFTLQGISHMTDWYSSVSPTISMPPPLSEVHNLNIPYIGMSGWIKLIDADGIHPSALAPFTNDIPFITDRFLPTESYIPYVGGDASDPGHATMVDVIPGHEVGGVAMGSIHTLPADENSQYGPSVPAYQTSIATTQELQDYVTSLLAAKPYTDLPLGATILEKGTVYWGRTGDVSLASIVIDPALGVESLGHAGTVLIITDAEGALADVTFEGNINYEGKSPVVIIARNISLSHRVSVVNAVLVASGKLYTGTNAGVDVPLRIKGNIVALGGIVQQRVRSDSDHARPSVLMIFDPRVYLGAMSLLNVKDVAYTVVE